MTSCGSPSTLEIGVSAWVTSTQHEDDSHATYFEAYEYTLCDDDTGDAYIHDDTESTSDILQKLTFPYTKLEPELTAEDLLQLELLADELEISRLKLMGVLIPAETYAHGGEIQLA